MAFSAAIPFLQLSPFSQFYLISLMPLMKGVPFDENCKGQFLNADLNIRQLNYSALWPQQSHPSVLIKGIPLKKGTHI